MIVNRDFIEKAIAESEHKYLVANRGDEVMLIFGDDARITTNFGILVVDRERAIRAVSNLKWGKITTRDGRTELRA